jgi:hypothetical protein
MVESCIPDSERAGLKPPSFWKLSGQITVQHKAGIPVGNEATNHATSGWVFRTEMITNSFIFLVLWWVL